MAKMEVEVISSEMIRPSTPTPSHQKYFKLSLLDQYANLTYTPMIFHYLPTTSDGNINQVLDRLKHSLSVALSCYYPLAGRIKDHVYVDCNDEGVSFTETHVNGPMSTFLKRPDLDMLFKFVPCHLIGPVTESKLDSLVQLYVYVNVFSCGGIAIGFCLLHRIIDGATLMSFIQCWANINAGGCQATPTNLDITSASHLFPPKEVPDGVSLSCPSWLFKEGKSVMRRFLFDNEAISRLKTEAASQLVPHPSRIQVVAAFIWKCILNSCEKKNGFKPSSVVVSAMNIRSKTSPPISKNSIGNIMWWVVVNHEADSEKHSGLKGYVSLLRDEFSKIDGDFFKRVQGEKGSAVIDKALEESLEFQSTEKREAILLSSLNQFKAMELDFGWGRPVWSSHIRGWSNFPVYINQVILAETGCDGGIEAWLLLGEHEMDILENDPEFVTLATSNPSVPMPLSRL